MSAVARSASVGSHEDTLTPEDVRLFRSFMRVARTLQGDGGEHRQFPPSDGRTSISSRTPAISNDMSTMGIPSQYQHNFQAPQASIDTYGGGGEDGGDDDGEDNDDDDNDEIIVNQEPRVHDNSRYSQPWNPTQPEPAHADAEKRYRRAINDKIQHLFAMLQSSSNGGSEGSLAPVQMAATQETPSKSVVLDNVVQHIGELISTYQQYEMQEDRLRKSLQKTRDELSAAL